MQGSFRRRSRTGTSSSVAIRPHPRDDEPVTRPSFISSEAVAAVLTWEDAIDAVRAAYAQPENPAGAPPRTVARGEGSWLRTLPAGSPGPPGLRGQPLGQFPQGGGPRGQG